MFDEIAKPKGKPKRGASYYGRRWLLLACLILLGAVAVYLGLPRYFPTQTGETYFSPDGKFFANIEPIPAGFGYQSASVSNGWSLNTPPTTGSANFYAWSANSRYAIFTFSNHYGNQDMFLFDTQRWLWNGPDDCDMFAMSVCTFENPLAKNGRYLLLRNGDMLNLTGWISDLSSYYTDLKLELVSYELAAWSPHNTHIAIVGVDAQGKKALFIGNEAGESLRALIPLEAEFEVATLVWSRDGSEVTVNGVLNSMLISSAADVPR